MRRDVCRESACFGEIQVIMCDVLVKMMVLVMMIAVLLTITSVLASPDAHVTFQW